MQSDHRIELIPPKRFFGAETLSELAALTENYPYFQIAHILYALSLKANKDNRYYSELRKASCYAGDRKQLFYGMNEGFIPPEDDSDSDETSFNLIDFYLSTNEKEEDNLSEETLSEIISASNGSSDYLAYNANETQDNPQEKPLLRHQDIIDKFLEEDKKSPIRISLKEEPEDWESPAEKSETSEESDSGSKTLVKIYIKQKKYDKALEIIRKLSLLYPEKNRYFADQIQFLEKVIIHTKNKT
ncbi:MAG: hypothetical protein LBH12_04155 [Dysgonamonadaceae bacterium]|jgi:hypothetical protein|nr:hypothetical protein [Dysgonamonadaceae bacterium]